MTFDLVVDGRELTVEASPLASVADVLRANAVKVEPGALVLLEDDLVRADEVPVAQAQGASVRTAASFALSPLCARLSPLVSTLPEAPRAAVVAAAHALVVPDALASVEELPSLLAPFAPGHDLAEATALLRKELVRAARALEARPARKAPRKRSPARSAARRSPRRRR